MRAPFHALTAVLRRHVSRRPIIAALSALALLAAPAGAMSYRWLFTSRVMAHDTNFHFVSASGSRVTVRGDGDTDLDCYLLKNGSVIAVDDDDTDYCILETDGYAGPYTLVVKNWGSVYNQYDVSVE